MKARDLEPLLYPKDRDDRFEGDIIARCNQLLAILQQLDGSWACLMPNVNHDCALNCRVTGD